MQLAAWAVVFFSASVQGTVGFGMNALAAPLLLVIQPGLVPVPLLVAHLTLTIFMSAAEIGQSDTKVIKWALTGAIPGVIVGAWLLDRISITQLTIAAMIVLAVAVVVVLAGIHIGRGPRSIFAAGVFSGTLGTTISVNGPPLALAVIHLPAAARRGTMAIYLMAVTVLSLLALTLVGETTAASLINGIILTPAAIAGHYAARLIHHKVDKIDARAIVVPAAVLAITITTIGTLAN